jgi:hypothetical protein
LDLAMGRPFILPEQSRTKTISIGARLTHWRLCGG